MKTSFLHIFFIPKKGTPEADVLDVMNLALDWYKYSNTNWVVKTSSDIKRWQERLRPFVSNESGLLLIVEFDVNTKKGFMPLTFWKWIKGEGVKTEKAKKAKK